MRAIVVVALVACSSSTTGAVRDAGLDEEESAAAVHDVGADERPPNPEGSACTSNVSCDGACQTFGYCRGVCCSGGVCHCATSCTVPDGGGCP